MAGGGFAGGLAQGISSGVQLGNQIKQTGMYQKESDRRDQVNQWAQEDRDKMKSGLDSFFQEANKVLTFRTDGSGQPMTGATQPQPVMMDPGFKRMPGFAKGGLIRFAGGGMIPDAVFSDNPASAHQSPGLASAQAPQRAPAEQSQPESSLDARQEFTKQMLSSDLLNNPEKLSKLSALADMHGVGDQIKPFLERAYTAKKSGMIDGAMQLMRGQVDEAIDSLARGGIKLEDRPTPVDPKNPRLWKINISGVGEREMDIGDLLQTTLDPEKFLKYQLDQNESHGKRAVSDSAVRENDSRAGVNNAQADYIRGAKTQSTMGKLGGGSGRGRADRPEKIDAALKRRDSTLDALSSVTGEDGKPFVDPQKRMQYSSLVVGSEQMLTDALGRDLTAKEQHKLTDLVRTAGTVKDSNQWKAKLAQTFGIGGQSSTQAQHGQQDQPQVAPVDPAALASTVPASAPPAPTAPPKAGGLQALREQQALRNQLTGVRQALKNPNLSTQQKQALSLQANEILNQIQGR